MMLSAILRLDNLNEINYHNVYCAQDIPENIRFLAHTILTETERTDPILFLRNQKIDDQIFGKKEKNFVCHRIDKFVQYGSTDFGYHENTLQNYINAVLNIRSTALRLSFEVYDRNLEFNLPQEFKYEYEPAELRHGRIPNMIEVAEIDQIRRTQQGHKSIEYKFSKAFLVKTVFINTLLLMYNLPIYPIFFIVDFNLATYGREQNFGRIRQKGVLNKADPDWIPRRVITDAEITMAYKLLYEHTCEFMRYTAQCSFIFLRMIRSADVRDRNTEFEIINNQDVFTPQWAQRTRKGGLPSYEQRSAAQIPHWVQRQQQIIEGEIEKVPVPYGLDDDF